MNSSSDIDVSLSVDAGATSEKKLVVTFLNQGGKSYFLDKKVIFFDGRYTISCLKILKYDDEIFRKMNLKLRPSKFPEDFVELKPGAAIIQSLDLNKYFDLPVDGVLEIQYQCGNFNSVTGERDQISSEKITWDLSR